MKTVKQVSRLCGISVRTIQYYDKIHLLKPSAKTAAGYRLYSDADVQKLQQILFLKELDFRLKDIRVIISNPRLNKTITFRRQKELLRAKRQHIDQLIHVLEQLEHGSTAADCAKHINAIKSQKKELKSMNKIIKISTLAICLCVISAGGYAVYKLQQPSTANPVISPSEQYTTLHINQVNQPSAAHIDAEARPLNHADLPSDFVIVNRLQLPDDLSVSSTYAYYIKSSQSADTYDKLTSYSIHYGKLSRSVSVSFAADHAPLRDYRFADGQASDINGHTLTIYRHEDTYFAEFTIKNNFFDVEATGLSQSEFTTLLASFFQ